MSILYKQITVWKRLNATSAIQYFCFGNMSNKQFCVQSGNFYHHPRDKEQALPHLKMAVELFIEIEPADRCDWFATLEGAIAAHDRDFA